jgi:hypothetical protein
MRHQGLRSDRLWQRGEHDGARQLLDEIKHRIVPIFEPRG